MQSLWIMGALKAVGKPVQWLQRKDGDPELGEPWDVGAEV